MTSIDESGNKKPKEGIDWYFCKDCFYSTKVGEINNYWIMLCTCRRSHDFQHWISEFHPACDWFVSKEKYDGDDEL